MTNKLTLGRLLVRTAVVATPIAILVGGIGGFVVLGSLREKPKPAEQAPPGLAVFTAPVARMDYAVEVASQGLVKARREAEISAQVGGRVTYVAPDLADGGVMRAGAVLVRLDPADFQLAVTRARSGVDAARAALQRELAESAVARQEWAELGQGTPSPLALREPQLQTAQSQLAAAEASLKEAELALSRTEVRAPFEGRVMMRSVEVGQIIAPGQTLARAFGIDAVEIGLALSDKELGLTGLPPAFNASKSTPGPIVQIRATVAGQPHTWSARIERTSAAVDTQTRLLSAIAVVENPFARADAPLAPGLFVDASIDGVDFDNVLTVPREALRGEDKVYVADGEFLRIRTVEVAYTEPKLAVIMSGLSETDKVVVSPVQAPFDGMRIRAQERRTANIVGSQPQIATATTEPANTAN